MPQKPLTIVSHEPLTITSVEPLPKQERTWGDTARDLLPAVGGAIGGMVGGPGGAAMGGAAGEGYRTLAENAGEILPALADIGRNWRHAGAMQEGFKEGATEGGLGAGVQGAIQGAFSGAGNLLAAGARRVAPGLMQSALKPGIRSTLSATKRGQVPPVVQALLDEGVSVTPGGIEKLNRIITSTNDDIANAISGMTTGTTSPLSVAGRLSPMARRAAVQVNPADDLAAISDVGEQFLASHGGTDIAAKTLSPSAMQSLKQGTYRALGDKSFGELKSASVEAQKTLARGLKEEIEKEAAKSGLLNVGAMNAREGAAITAQDAIAKRLAQVANRDPGGLAWLAHSPATFIAAITMRSSAAKSMLARGLYNEAARIAGVPVETLRWAVGAIASSQEPE